MTSLKLSFQGETRRVKMGDHHFYSFDHLAYQAKTLFPTLHAVAQVDFVYVDEERERIVVSSQEEYDEALLILLHINPRVVRFDVKVPPSHSAYGPSSASKARQQQEGTPFRHNVSQNNRAVVFDLNDLFGIATGMCSAYQQQQQTSRGPVRGGAAGADTCPSAGPGAAHKAAAHASPTSQAAKVSCCPFKVLSGARNTTVPPGKDCRCPVFAHNTASSAHPASGCCGANRGRASGNKCRSGNKSTSNSSFPLMFEQILGNVTEDIDEMFLQSAIKQSLGGSFNSSSNSSSASDSDYDGSPSSQHKQKSQQNGANASTDYCFKMFEQLLNVPHQRNHPEKKQASCGAGAGAGVWAAGSRAGTTNTSSSSIPPTQPSLESSVNGSTSNTAGGGGDEAAAVAASFVSEKKEDDTAQPMVFVSDVSTPASPRSPASTSINSTDGGENKDSSFVQVSHPADAELRTAMSHQQQPSATITSPLPAVTQLEPEMLWRRELDILREMGFVSIPTTVLVDVLKTELITPAQYGSAPSARGMQRVVDQIAELM